MVLLPDMTFDIDGGTHILSLQDPYTLNGKLIVACEITEEPEYVDAHDNLGATLFRYTAAIRRIVRFMNEDSFAISLPYEYLVNEVRNTLLQFFRENEATGNVIRVGESPRYYWNIGRHYNEENYLTDIKEQCGRVSVYHSYSYIEACRSRLREQGRMPRRESESEARIRDLRFYYDSSLYGNNVIDNGTTWTISFDSSPNITTNTASSITSTPSKKYIHTYNYKPEYIKHYMPDEDETTLLLGAEIEVDCGGESEEHAKNVLEIICGIDPESIKEVLEDKMYCTHDGSLRNGIEFDTMPCTLEYHKNEMNYKKMFKYLDEHGYKAHDTDTCGLHVHANRSYLGKSELMQQLTISKILYILEKFNDEICVIARRNNRYSQFMGKGKDEKSIVELYGKYKSGINSKYVALNLQHDETIEFRCFKSTLKYETFILTLEFVKNIIDYAKSINIEEIELMKWSDLMDTFSDELKEYYNTRLKKENKKEKEEKSNTNNRASINIGSGTIHFANGSTINGLSGTVSYCDDYYDSSSDTLRELSNYLRSYITADCTASISSFSTSMELSSGQISNSGYIEDPIESLKKEIKSLKKKIKNCNNYMERIQLSTELNEKQKELKQLKRERRLAS